MAIFMPTTSLGGAVMAACGTWPNDCTWRTSTGCQDKLTVRRNSSDCFDLGRCVYLGITGGWWSGYIGTNCAGSDSYVSVVWSSLSGTTFTIDVAKALDDAVWTSSFTFNVYGFVTSFSDTKNLLIGTAVSALPADVSKSTTPPTGSSSNCGSTGSNLATVTVYDDGSFAVS